MAISEKKKKLLGKKARSIENSKKSVAATEYCKQINTMKQALEEKSEAIQQMNDELLHKNLIIEQKDEIIAHYDEKLRQKDLVISEKEIIISQQLEHIDELNEIIDMKEFVIIKKEDFIEEQIQLTKAQDRKINELKSVTCALEERIVQLEEANKHNKSKTNANHRKPGDYKAMHDRLKICYNSSMMRCQVLERNILELEQYIECLHATLERNGIFEDIFWVDDFTDKCTADGKENLSTEINANSSHHSDSQDDFTDTSIKRITNELILMIDNDDPIYQFSDIFEHKPSRNISDMKPKGILSKKATIKKPSNPMKKVKFANLVTVAYF